jgi:hypothetical protein
MLPAQFDLLCQTLFVQDFGPDARIISGPRTGPLDAIAVVSPEETGEPEIFGLISKYSSGKSELSLIKRIKADLLKLAANPDRYGHAFPGRLIIATNHSLTVRAFAAIRRDMVSIFGESVNLELWEGSTISQMLDAYPDVRNHYLGTLDYIDKNLGGVLDLLESAKKNRESTFEFTPISQADNIPEVVSTAWWRLLSTQETVTGLFKIFHSESLRSEESGELTSIQQDLLRAAIVFTSAGVDSCLDALLRHAVPVLAAGEGGARTRFELYISEQVNAPKVTSEFIAALKSDLPRPQMMDLYISSITKASFQGSGSIKSRGLASLGISNSQIDSSRLSGLNDFFQARNDVAHRLDLVNPKSDGKPQQQARLIEDVGPMCDRVFILLNDVISATIDNLKEIKQVDSSAGRLRTWARRTP